MRIVPFLQSPLKSIAHLMTVLLLSGLGPVCADPAEMIQTEDLTIRAPFVVADKDTETYYLYATHQDPETKRRGVQAYSSKDLESWTEGSVVFEIPDGGWADPTSTLWAPEVHLYNGNYYLFATLSNPSTTLTTDQKNRPDLYLRATAIFVSNSPEGPFKAVSDQPATPTDWMSLAGTLWVEDGMAWMVFCHGWWQVVDGTFELVPLAPDLSKPLAAPLTLYKASDGKWTRDMKALAHKKGSEQPSGKVSDGAYLYQTKNGGLIMLWSSFGDDGYACSYATSRSGKITGPWIPAEELLFDQDGGHGMIFETFDGRLMMALHAPNSPGDSRAQFIEIEDTGDAIQIKQPPEAPAATEPAPNDSPPDADIPADADTTAAETEAKSPETATSETNAPTGK